MVVLMLAVGIVALSIGVLVGVLRARRAAEYRRSTKAQASSLPMFKRRPPDGEQRRRSWLRKKTAAAPTTVRLRPQSAGNRRKAMLLLVGLIIIGGGVLLIYNRVPSTIPIPTAGAVELAVQLPLSGEAASSGLPPSEGIQMAIEEANASGSGSPFKLTSYDDQGSSELARGVAEQIAASQALLVLGPAFSSTALATGPTFASADMVALPTNATSDQITANLTTFRMLFKNSEQGELLANYLVRVLGQKQAAVFVADTSYGQTLREGFERAATALELEADYYVFRDAIQASEMAEQVAQNPDPPAVVLLTLDREGARILIALRRRGVSGPFLGGDSFGKQSFTELVNNQPEEREQPGFFTNQLYALAPLILDSANGATLAFAERYRTRFGQDPEWSAISGYEAATLAVAAVRATAIDPAINRNLLARREALGVYLRGLSSPAQALPGLLGPIWFDEGKGRQLAIRVGRFRRGHFESASAQIVTVSTPNPTELASGAIFELSPGRYARLQLVAHTGIFINELTSIDMRASRFIADFYLWMRFARINDVRVADPTKLRFPDMVSGTFEREQPVRQLVMEDGSEYWLWRVRGEFRSAPDLRRFPFDQQNLALGFVNADATAEQILYARDRQIDDGEAPLSLDGGATADVAVVDGGIADPEALRNLGEWTVASTYAERAGLSTDSLLGDPTRDELSARLDISGFTAGVILRRTLP
ncbi:MAG: hypothetical protein EOM24_06885, partial [Chloroflexia bacterium]|nr:hypothetical protein [Chloroflexia bacterium]